MSSCLRRQAASGQRALDGSRGCERGLKRGARHRNMCAVRSIGRREGGGNRVEPVIGLILIVISAIEILGLSYLVVRNYPKA